MKKIKTYKKKYEIPSIEIVKYYYQHNIWDIKYIKKLLRIGKITQDEFFRIIAP